MRFLAARPVLTHGHAACFCAGALPRAKAVPVLTHGHAACFRAGALPQARAVPMLIHGHATCFCAGALPRAKAVPALAHGYAPVSVLVRKAGAAQICGPFRRTRRKKENTIAVQKAKRQLAVKMGAGCVPVLGGRQPTFVLRPCHHPISARWLVIEFFACINAVWRGRRSIRAGVRQRGQHGRAVFRPRKTAWPFVRQW